MKLSLLLFILVSNYTFAGIGALQLEDEIIQSNVSDSDQNSQDSQESSATHNDPQLTADIKLGKKLTLLSDYQLSNSDLAAEGGFSSGGGGNAVVCMNSSGLITEIQLLDYIEGLLKDSAINPSIDLSGESVKENIQIAFERMKTRWPFLGDRLLKKALDLESNLNSYLVSAESVSLTPLYDMNLTIIPNSNSMGDQCAIARFAVQHRNNLQGQKKFSFVKELYLHPKTSTQTKAGIIIHEILYEAAIRQGAVNSDFIRWFTYILSSTSFDKLTSDDFQSLETDHRAEFLKGYSIQYFIQEDTFVDSTEEFRSFKEGEKVYFFENQKLGEVDCYQVGLCQVKEGIIKQESRSSTGLFPKFDIASSGNDIPGLLTSDLAKQSPGLCYPEGGCIGAKVKVRKFSFASRVSYEGEIIGIFGEGDFAVKVMPQTLKVSGINFASPDVLILYAERSTISY